MTYRFSSDGRRVSLLGYGAMRMATVDGGHANSWAPNGYSRTNIDQELLERQIRMLLEGGVNYFDTSPAYCRGESESRLGRALAKSGWKREDYIVATKLSNFAPSQFSKRSTPPIHRPGSVVCPAVRASSATSRQPENLMTFA